MSPAANAAHFAPIDLEREHSQRFFFESNLKFDDKTQFATDDLLREV